MALKAVRSLRIDYDEAKDILTVDGVRYSGELFRQFGLAPNPYMLIQIVQDDDVVNLHTYMVDMKKFREWLKTQEQ